MKGSSFTVSAVCSFAMSAVCSFTVPAAVLALLAATPASSLPLYASREGAVCQTCHIDPNGGGIRNEYGFSYEKNRHATEPEPRWSSMTVNPKLNDWITLGLDMRVLYVASHVNADRRTLSTSTFFPMEGQVNLAVMPHEHLTLVASEGLLVDQEFSYGYVARELYGMVEGLPGDVYVRVGRFRIPFGLRQDDHTSYVRSLEFLPYDSQKPDAGIEVGHVGAEMFGQISFTNGSPPFTERAQTLAAKVGLATRSFQAGISGLHRFSENSQAAYNYGSLYGSATRGRVTALAEAAAATNETAFGGERNLGAAFVELDLRAGRGLNLRGKVDALDRNRNDSYLSTRRWTGEVEWNPVPFAQARVAFRYNEEDVGPDFQEYLTQFQFPF